MSVITNSVDGDTFESEEGKVRLSNINTPESVHPDEEKNTEAGEKASEFTKNLTSTGTVQTTHDYGVDHHGRKLSGVTKTINDKDIDLGLVLLDQGYSTYQTRYGEAKDPALHDAYKEYFAKNSPYQYGEFRQAMDPKDYEAIGKAQQEFKSTYSKFKDGGATQEELDQATYNLYKDPQKVAHFRHVQAGWGKEVEATSMGNSDRESIIFALQDNPEAAEQYNRAVRNGHLSVMKRPEQEKDFWEKIDLSFSQMNSVANGNDRSELLRARGNNKEYDIPPHQLTKGLDEKYHSIIMDEVDQYGEAAGIVLRDQLAEDVENNRVFDNMEWYAQIGYGGLAVVIDPLTLLPAGKIAQGVQAAEKATKMYQLSKAIEGSRLWAQGRAFSNISKGAAWASAGMVEGAIQAFPRLDGDHTYTARDYQMDIMMGGLFGTALGGVVEVGKFGVLKRQENQSAAQKQVEELDEHIANPEKEKFNSEAKNESEAEAVNAGNSQQTVHEWVGLPDEPTQGKSLSEMTFTPWAAIDKVSTTGYQKAGRKIRNMFPKGSPMQMLINQQIGLNNKKLTPEIQELSEELNSQILHLASVYPDGKVPPLKMKEIQGVMFSQKDVRTVNVMDQVLQGKTTNQKGLLSEYVTKLQGLKEFGGNVPAPKSSLDFAHEFSDIINMESKVDKDDLFTLTQDLPKEVSFIKDMLEMNKLARKEADPEFTKLVEQLNGIVAARLKQIDNGATVKQKTKSFGQKVQLSGPEIIARLKAKGLKPKTPEWKAAFAQLRKGEIEVSPEVNEVGRLDKATSRSFKVEQDQAIDSVEMGAEKTHETILEHEADKADILPRDVSHVDSVSAYKNPTKENLEKLRNKLRAMNKKNGSTVISGKRERMRQRDRLNKIAKRMKTNKQVTVQRMLDNGNMADLVDVIRVSHTLADEARLKAKAVKPTGGESIEANPIERPITEEEVDTLYAPDVDKKLTKEEQVDIQTRVDASVDKSVDESAQKIADGLAEFVRSGEKKRFEVAAKPTGALDHVGRMLNKMTKGVGEIFIDSKLTSLKYLGAKVTEVGRGFGGNAKRAPTASIIRDAKFKESIVKVIPQYRKMIDAYAISKGKGQLGRLKARERTGQTNEVVNQFNRDVFLVQEYRRQGKSLPKSIDKSVTDFVDQWDHYMDYNHNVLVDSGAAGFVKDRKVKHYIPHVWQAGKFKAVGEEKAVAVLSKAYMNLQTSAKPISKDVADAQAKKLYDDVISDDYQTADHYSPTMDARAKARRDLDTTAELDGVSVLDLLDSDVVSLAAKYSNRVGGWVGLSKATKGLLSSQKDIDVFKANLIEEANEAGVNTKRYAQMFDDTIDQLFGRPTKRELSTAKGLPQELRELKDLAALTKMGGLGSAQLAETGQVITRSMINLFSNPKTAKKVLNMGREGKNDSLLLEEIQSISNITNDLEFLERQSTHLDQTELNEASVVRKLSLKVANLATGGELKAEASRGLGKLSGYNMIRRAQTRVVQSSFMLDLANHFVNGKGVMGNARMADLGITDTLGKNPELEAAFKKHAEFKDGVLSKLNIDKWDKDVREQLQYAMIRDEAQQIQRTHVGELPPWLNRPLMGLIFQFRQMPIVATSKSLSRSLAFADKEAVTGVMLNSAIAGLVRYSKFALLGAATAAAVGKFGDGKDVTEDQTQVHKYITQFGIFPDLHDLVLGRNGVESINDLNSSWEAVQGQVPVMGLMNDYYEAGNSGAKGDIKGMVESAANLVPLSNTAIGEVMQSALEPMINELPDGE